MKLSWSCYLSTHSKEEVMSKVSTLFFFTILMLFSLGSSDAQKSPAIRKIGFLGASRGPGDAYEVFRRSLEELGYADGRNIVIELRGADSRPRLLELANELIREKVELIVASGGPATRSAKDATNTIPIVFTT